MPGGIVLSTKNWVFMGGVNDDDAKNDDLGNLGANGNANNLSNISVAL